MGIAIVEILLKQCILAIALLHRDMSLANFGLNEDIWGPVIWNNGPFHSNYYLFMGILMGIYDYIADEILSISQVGRV